VTQLGDPGGYTNLGDADAVANNAWTEMEAASRRQVVLEHEGRFYAFEARAFTGLDAHGAPCRIPDADGTLALWRAGKFMSSPSGTRNGWVHFVWWPTGQDMCTTGDLSLYYVGMHPCT